MNIFERDSEILLSGLSIQEMIIYSLTDSMKTCNLKDNTMNESDLQSVFNYPIYPRDSKIFSDKGFVNIDNGSMGGGKPLDSFLNEKYCRLY